MADGYTYKAKINGEWVDINLIESPTELTKKLEKDEEWAKVVRCKECKWYYQHWIDAGIMVEHCHRVRGVVVKADGFCAWGKRREDE